MPSRPLGYCGHPGGCGNRTTGGRCPEHRPPRRGGGGRRAGYGVDWERLRKQTPPTPCADCGRPWEPLFHLDHEDGNRYNNHPENHRWRCPSCHSTKTSRYDGGFGNRKQPYPGEGR